MKNSTHRMSFQRIVEHHLTKIFTTILRNFGLLFGIAVVLKRQDHWEFRSLKCALCNSLNYFLVTQNPKDKRSIKRIGLFQKRWTIITLAGTSGTSVYPW